MEGEPDSCDFYCLTQEDFTETDPSKWLNDFQDVVRPFHILKLGKDDVLYLTDPGIKIPIRGFQFNRQDSEEEEEEEGNNSGSWVSSLSQPPSPPQVFRTLYGSEEESEEEDESRRNNQQHVDDYRRCIHLAFKHCLDEIREGIDILGGAVIPKLNWKVPKDARWIAFNKSLKCQTIEDVLLLLKHSCVADKAVEDMDTIPMVNEQPQSHTLTLFKWDDGFGPEYEFRCFVADKKLILIAQRDSYQAYTSIPLQRDGIIRDIHNFFREHIYARFPLNYYVFDVMRMNGRLVLLDFNVFGLETDPGLTSYKELKHLMTETEGNLVRGGLGQGLVNSKIYGEPYFRYATEALVGSANPDLQCPLPLDMVTHFLDSFNNQLKI